LNSTNVQLIFDNVSANVNGSVRSVNLGIWDPRSDVNKCKRKWERSEVRCYTLYGQDQMQILWPV